jgi:hypothetical protein
MFTKAIIGFFGLQNAKKGLAVKLLSNCINAANEATYSFQIRGYNSTDNLTWELSDGVNTVSDTIIEPTLPTITISNVDTSTLNEGPITITITQGVESVIKNTTKDTTAPTGYSCVLGNENNSFTQISTLARITFNNLVVGDTINWNIETIVTGSFVATQTTQEVREIDVSSVVDGSIRARFTATDPCGNTGSLIGSNLVTKNTIPPSGYTFSWDETVINNQNHTAAELDFRTMPVGAQAYLTFESDAGGTPIETDFTIASADFKQSFDVSSLPNGQLTATLVVVDLAGNVGTAQNDTIIKAVATPSAYLIAWGEASYDSTTGLSASASITGANVGNTYHYEITSSGGGTPITGTGTVASASFTIEEDITSLNSGTGTIEYYEEDPNGNIGDDVSDTATFDLVAIIYGRMFDGINDDLVRNTPIAFTGDNWWIKLRVFDATTAAGAHIANDDTSGEFRVTGLGYYLRFQGDTDSSYLIADFPANSYPPITGAIVDFMFGKEGGVRFVEINGVRKVGTATSNNFTLTHLFSRISSNRFWNAGLFEYENSLGNIANEANNWLGFTVNGAVLKQSTDGGATWT